MLEYNQTLALTKEPHCSCQLSASSMMGASAQSTVSGREKKWHSEQGGQIKTRFASKEGSNYPMGMHQLSVGIYTRELILIQHCKRIAHTTLLKNPGRTLFVTLHFLYI